MVIINQQGNEIQNPDLSLGYLKDYRRLVAHHEAIEYQPPVYESVVVKTYANGGVLKERRLVTPAVNAQDAWDEYEDVQLYTLYTEEEHAAIEEEKKHQKEEVKKAEEEMQVDGIAEAVAQKDAQIAQMLNLIPKAAALSTATSRAINFTKKTWVDDPTTGTPITAADMNRLEQAIVDLDNIVTSLQDSAPRVLWTGNESSLNTELPGISSAMMIAVDLEVSNLPAAHGTAIVSPKQGQNVCSCTMIIGSIKYVLNLFFNLQDDRITTIAINSKSYQYRQDLQEPLVLISDVLPVFITRIVAL